MYIYATSVHINSVHVQTARVMRDICAVISDDPLIITSVEDVLVSVNVMDANSAMVHLVKVNSLVQTRDVIIVTVSRKYRRSKSGVVHKIFIGRGHPTKIFFPTG